MPSWLNILNDHDVVNKVTNMIENLQVENDFEEPISAPLPKRMCVEWLRKEELERIS